MARLTKSFIDKLALGGDYTEWDDAIPGFGIRIRGTVKTWIIKYRNIEGRQRKMSLGRATALTPEEARTLAKKYLGQVASGYDPAGGKIETRNAITVEELCDLYIKDKGWLATGRKDKKASTLLMDKSRIERHVKPLLGKRKVMSLTQQDLFNFMRDVNQCFLFDDTKTGRQTRPFGKSALALLKAIQKHSQSEWVFPATMGNGHYVGLPKLLNSISNRKLDEKDKSAALNIIITAHMLRHTYASIAAEMGYSELTIAGLLGHKMKGVTHRYSHLPDKAFISAADAVSLEIDKALEGK